METMQRYNLYSAINRSQDAISSLFTPAAKIEQYADYYVDKHNIQTHIIPKAYTPGGLV